MDPQGLRHMTKLFTEGSGRGVYNWFQNLFWLRPAAKPVGQRSRQKGLGSVLKHASEPFSPRALTTSFSLDLATKQVLKTVVENT